MDLVRLLLEKCSHLDHTGAGSVTALHISCMAGHLEVTRALAQRGANIEARDAVSFSPLHIACLFGNESVRILLGNVWIPKLHVSDSLRHITFS